MTPSGGGLTPSAFLFLMLALLFVLPYWIVILLQLEITMPLFLYFTPRQCEPNMQYIGMGVNGIIGN